MRYGPEFETQAIRQQQSSGVETTGASAKGKELRAAIERIYAALPLTLGKDISNIVAGYIPLETPLGRAEAILVGAGLTVDPSRKTYVRANEAIYWQNHTEASLVRSTNGSILKLFVELVPEKPVDDASVKAIRALLSRLPAEPGSVDIP